MGEASDYHNRFTPWSQPSRIALVLGLAVLFGCDQRSVSEVVAPIKAPEANQVWLRTRVSVGPAVAQTVSHRVRHFVSWNARADVGTTAELPLSASAQFVLVMATDDAGSILLAARAKPGIAIELNATTTADALLFGQASSETVDLLRKVIEKELAAGGSIESPVIETLLSQLNVVPTAATTIASLPVVISSTVARQVNVANNGQAYYSARAFSEPANEALASPIVLAPNTAGTLSPSASRIRVEVGLSWPDNGPRLIRIGIEVVVFAGLGLPSGQPEQRFISCATEAVITSAGSTLEKAAMSGDAFVLADAIVSAVKASRPELTVCMGAYVGEAGGALLGRAAIAQFWRIVATAFSAAKLMVYDGPYLVEITTSAVTGPLKEKRCSPTTTDIYGPDCDAVLTLTIPRRVIGLATYDPVLLWGTRCTTTLGYSVTGSGRIRWEPGSSWTWFQYNADGVSGPSTIPTPTHILSGSTLQGGQTGSIPYILTGGNDRNHPSSAPWFDGTATIKYSVEGNPEIKSATYSVFCTDS